MYSNEGMTKDVIISSLARLNIYYDPGSIKNGWMKIRCPSPRHYDNTPSAGIHIGTGIISCFSCPFKSNLQKVIQQRFNCSYKEAQEFIFGNDYISNYSPQVYEPKKKDVPEDIRVEPKENYVTVPFNPEDYYYTKIRGYTKEYCDQFGIELCYSFKYEDYILTPIKDTKLGINTFEARKLLLHERLISYYGINRNTSPENVFKRIKKRNGYEYKEGAVIDKDGITHYDDNLIYFMKPKVLYPALTAVSHTLFNIDNLNRNDHLYATEGSASLPKVYLISKNCTCTFGSKLTKKQVAYLKEFKKNIYLIPDNDQAGKDMIEFLVEEGVQDLYVIKIKSEDTDESYIHDIKKCKPILAKEYVGNKLKELL